MGKNTNGRLKSNDSRSYFLMQFDSDNRLTTFAVTALIQLTLIALFKLLFIRGGGSPAHDATNEPPISTLVLTLLSRWHASQNIIFLMQY